MTEQDKTQMTEKVCPLIGAPCMKERCTLYVETMQPNQKLGTASKVHVCGLLLQPIITLMQPQGSAFGGRPPLIRG